MGAEAVRGRGMPRSCHTLLALQAAIPYVMAQQEAATCAMTVPLGGKLGTGAIPILGR